MENNIRRARDLLPSIIITVLSMIQALALELYWSRIQAADYLWQGGWNAAIGWAQLTVMLLGILQIWVIYVSLMLRFSWLPTMQDTLLPFAIGLLEFSLISLMGSEQLGIWFLWLAAVFSLAVGATHTAFKQARKDAQNDYYFKNRDPASWRDYTITIVAIAGMIVCGIALWASGNRGALAMTALLYAGGILLYQILMTKRYWMHTLVGAEPARPDTE